MLLRFVLIIYVIIHSLVFVHFYKRLNEITFSKSFYIYNLTFIIRAIVSTVPLFSVFISNIDIKRLLIKVGNYYLGFIFYFLIVFVITSLLLRLTNTDDIVFWKRLIFCSLISIAIIIYGNYNAKNIRSTYYTVDQNTKSHNNLKIAYVSDFHLGGEIGLKEMTKMVDMINSYKPDIVFIGGDIFDSSYDMIREPQKIIKKLTELKSKYGVYGVWGNHDVEENLMGGFSINNKSKAIRSKEMEDFMKESHIKMLSDQNIVISDKDIEIIGRVDKTKSGNGLNTRKPIEDLIDKNYDNIIVLDHSPEEFDKLDKNGVDLLISGHTHDGQFFPLNLTQFLIRKNPYGYKKFGNLNTIVSSGLGIYGIPVRIGTISEVVFIDYNY